ncbi:MAG TPA: hypothetical protein VFQ11_16230 [Nocardioidaceae bacterium]|jgi:hypothetical protein|nr:hypothetical protein [Nocardioidaceae bacterium]
MTYPTIWARCWSLVGAVGVGLSFFVWRPVGVVTVFATAALCAGLLLALLAPAARPQSQVTAVRWSRVASRAGLAGAGVVAVGGYSAVLPALAIPLVLGFLASHPWCLDIVRRWRSQHRPAQPSAERAPGRDAGGDLETPEVTEGVAALPARPAPGQQRPEVTAVTAQQLSDQELCRAWRHSFVTLQDCRSAPERARVVAQRQVYLDEMERRSPSGLRAWLESGARAAGGPERFLGKGQDDQTDAA